MRQDTPRGVPRFGERRRSARQVAVAEGRKSLVQRYAGIESGAECDRWAAVLSAMVDGEATAADLVDVRPHLRNCPACRATVRELRRASVPLAAVFPAAGLALADGPFGQAGGLLGRLAEWVLWATFRATWPNP